MRSGIATLPHGSSWLHLLGVGILAGLGFTMSIFIASLAFTDGAQLSAAKLSVLIASAIAGALGIFLLSRVSAAQSQSHEDVATVEEAV